MSEASLLTQWNSSETDLARQASKLIEVLTSDSSYVDTSEYKTVSAAEM